MSENSKPDGWVLILNSVKTPLGFFTLVALVLDGVMLGTAALTDKLPMLAPLGLLALVVVLVFAIVWRKPYALYQPKDWRMLTVNLVFLEPDQARPDGYKEKQPIDVDLDVPHCEIVIRDQGGQVKQSSTVPNLTLDRGGWSFQLAEDVGPSDSVRLELCERGGQKWSVRPFPPYGTDQKAYPVN